MTTPEHSDTAKLLRVCDAGIKMGISSLGDLIPKVNSPALEEILTQSRMEHENLRAEAEMQLNKLKDGGKNPNPMAAAMSTLKTNLKMMNGSDHDAASLAANGCTMGIKKLNQYLDKYAAADSESKQLTSRIISAEEKLTAELERYL
ncbi:MAG: hypothetical protein IJ368_05455 [Oscillospiraceae bacterium]|nr:hypothetical protein [Oscillospiraceae bacterium]